MFDNKATAINTNTVGSEQHCLLEHEVIQPGAFYPQFGEMYYFHLQKRRV
jgi:hypothetical protein